MALTFRPSWAKNGLFAVHIVTVESAGAICAADSKRSSIEDYAVLLTPQKRASAACTTPLVDGTAWTNRAYAGVITRCVSHQAAAAIEGRVSQLVAATP